MVRPCIYRLNKNDLTSGGFTPKSKPSIFVAYRFNNNESRSFRSELERRMDTTLSLNHYEVTDGRSLPGKLWAREIRKRIKNAWLIVADLTQLNHEVFFECGLAWWHRIPILPVVMDEGWINKLPRWLTAIQTCTVSSDIGWDDLLNGITENTTPKRTKLQFRPPDPVPGKAVWLGGTDWFDRLYEQFLYNVNRQNLRSENITIPDSIDEIEESTVMQIAQSSMFVTALNNTSHDSFVHFALGLIVANPTCGAAKKSGALTRNSIVVIKNNLTAENVLADSARRVSSIIPTYADSLDNHLIKFGDKYQKWFKVQSQGVL